MRTLSHEPGTFEGMTQAERLKLAELRVSLAEELVEHADLSSDWSLYRFLRARNFNVEKARQMLLDFFQFRRENDYFEAMKIPFSDFGIIHENYSSGFAGVDFEGRPIVLEQVAFSHPEKILGYVPEKLVTDYVIQKHERLLHCVLPVVSRIQGRRIDKVIMIADLKDSGLSKLMQKKVQNYLALIANIGQNYFPDIMHKSYVLNAPLLFKGLWAIVKTMLDEKTVAKFCIESGNGLKVLAKVMDIGNLPVSMGGKFTGKIDLFNGPWEKELRDAWDNGTVGPSDRADELKYFWGVHPKDRVSHSENKGPSPKEHSNSKYSKIINKLEEASREEPEPQLTLLGESGRNLESSLNVLSSPLQESDLKTHLSMVQIRTAVKNKTMIQPSSHRMICFSGRHIQK